MTINKLASILSEMYKNASKGEAVAMIHLFGIKYADDIKKSGYSKKDKSSDLGFHHHT